MAVLAGNPQVSLAPDSGPRSRAALDGKIDIVQACRTLNALRAQLPASEREMFMTIIAIESDTEDVPVGELRSKVSKEFRDRIDREMSEYLPKVRPLFKRECEELIERYSSSMP